MERTIHWAGNKTWGRVEGNLTGQHTPIIALHGGPSLPSD